MNIVVANIGLRDLMIWSPPDGYVPLHNANAELFKRGNETPDCLADRAMLILDEVRDGRSHHWVGPPDAPPTFLLPILMPCLDHTSRGGERIGRILLLGTEQQDGHHARNNTIAVARLIQEYLIPLHRIEDDPTVDVLKITDINPSSFEEAFDFVQDRVAQHLRGLLHHPDEDRVVISLRGGIPAMNSALLMWAMGAYGPSTWLLEVDEPQAPQVAGEVFDLSTWKFRKPTLLREVRRLVGLSSFAGAAELLSLQLSDAERRTPHLGRALALARHAEARLRLDFEEAAQHLDTLADVEGLRRGVQASPTSLVRAAEMAATAVAYLEAGSLFDFVTRTAVFTDTLRRVLVTRLVGIQLDDCEVWLPQARLAPDLLGFLIKARINLNPANGFLMGPPLWNRIISHGKQQLKAKPVLKTVREAENLLAELKRLEHLRNATLHEGRAVTMAAVSSALRTHSPRSRFSELASGLLQAVGDVPGVVEDMSVVQGLYRTLGEDILRCIEEAEPDAD